MDSEKLVKCTYIIQAVAQAVSCPSCNSSSSKDVLNIGIVPGLMYSIATLVHVA